MTPEILKKITDGDGVTDEELDTAIAFFTPLEASLKLLGPHFHHAWYDVFCTVTRLAGFKQAREERDEHHSWLKS